MIERASEQVAELSMAGPARQVGDAGTKLWARMRAWLANYHRRRVAATLYAALSKLSDAELERRGIARGDLMRHCCWRAFSTDF
jgi:hypothetical protein